jgi:hypothetical protein
LYAISASRLHEVDNYNNLLITEFRSLALAWVLEGRLPGSTEAIPEGSTVIWIYNDNAEDTVLANSANPGNIKSGKKVTKAKLYNHWEGMRTNPAPGSAPEAEHIDNFDDLPDYSDFEDQ